MDRLKVLISGAGIAGLTLAYWLEKYGFSPSLVEKRLDLSDEGYMIDFLGPGFKSFFLDQIVAKSIIK